MPLHIPESHYPYFDLRGKRIEDTYQRLVQYDTASNSNYYNGYGYLMDLSTSYAISSAYSLFSLYATSASWASQSISSSYAISASWAPMPVILSSVSCSWASQSISSSYALTASWAPSSPSIYAASCSWASQSVSSSYALTASWAPLSDYAVSCSWASQSLSASYLPVGTYQFTSSWAISASWASQSISSSYASMSHYSVSASWASQSISSSYAITASWADNAASSSYTKTASFIFNPNGVNVIFSGHTSHLYTGSALSTDGIDFVTELGSTLADGMYQIRVHADMLSAGLGNWGLSPLYYYFAHTESILGAYNWAWNPGGNLGEQPNETFQTPGSQIIYGPVILTTPLGWSGFSIFESTHIFKAKANTLIRCGFTTMGIPYCSSTDNSMSLSSSVVLEQLSVF